ESLTRGAGRATRPREKLATAPGSAAFARRPKAPRAESGGGEEGRTVPAGRTIDRAEPPCDLNFVERRPLPPPRLSPRAGVRGAAPFRRRGPLRDEGTARAGRRRSHGAGPARARAAARAARLRPRPPPRPARPDRREHRHARRAL